ncbi:hypothetical protein [Pseudomonas xionganensis]|uniref:Uncharacterized protein n=1 Tax=Pseudomonas xionganensis TaxID=2654845 RepID=A0A6I4KPP3_9PSED|nr:hypothetical protein [Pseudomonas xionganensis]MVW73997.1 hypothetical protein [Pseudomonas xionganensis]
MKAWILGALLCLSASVSLAAWWGLNMQALQTPQALRPAITSDSASRPAPPAPTMVPIAPVTAPSGPMASELVVEPEEEPSLNIEEAQMLMQLMAEQGDPRSPVLGERRPRQAASAEQLADPEQYRAFEEQHSRALIMAYAGGVKQIPAIRQRIEQEAQAGTRNAEEIDEARAALQQLEMLQSKLQREAPELLP